MPVNAEAAATQETEDIIVTYIINRLGLRAVFQYAVASGVVTRWRLIAKT
jgi:hypothetical protein